MKERNAVKCGTRAERRLATTAPVVYSHLLHDCEFAPRGCEFTHLHEVDCLVGAVALGGHAVVLRLQLPDLALQELQLSERVLEAVMQPRTLRLRL
eukprot:2696970-Pyramimonas_sp.AAC.1